MIRGLSYDSRLTKKGDLFFAIPGQHADGHAYLPEAAKRGAVAALVERSLQAPLPTFVVPSVVAAMSKISNRFFEEPSRRMPVIGVTGTNGKTTVTYLIEDLLRKAGKSCGVIGTVNYRFGSDIRPAPNTTPMSLDVQAFLAEVLEKKGATVIMEVSSHALELNRVDDVHFAVGLFTNLTQDHLDFHKDMESYFAAKAKLFRNKKSDRVVLNLDDSYGERLVREFPQAIGFGFHEKAEVRASNHHLGLGGVQFELRLPSKKTVPIRNNLIGLHNIYNCLAGAAAMVAFGMAESDIVAGLNQNHAVPGRLERVDAGQPFVVLVDYAHTHDALEKALVALRETGPKRILCLFGAGGDRDRTKRPRMGRVAATLADQVYLTSDNPRSEDPQQIIREIEAGIKEIGKTNYAIEVDRAQAIHRALREARAGDVVLLAGKGHETVQIFKNERIHFSDQETAREALKSL